MTHGCPLYRKDFDHEEPHDFERTILTKKWIIQHKAEKLLVLEGQVKPFHYFDDIMDGLRKAGFAEIKMILPTPDPTDSVNHFLKRYDESKLLMLEQGDLLSQETVLAKILCFLDIKAAQMPVAV
ncbi:MAG: hypothetical protein WC763_05005 [Candidatus Paceibacterota bacterium]